MHSSMTFNKVNASGSEDYKRKDEYNTNGGIGLNTDLSEMKTDIEFVGSNRVCRRRYKPKVNSTFTAFNTFKIRKKDY